MKKLVLKNKIAIQLLLNLKSLLNFSSEKLRFPKAEPWSFVATNEILLVGGDIIIKGGHYNE